LGFLGRGKEGRNPRREKNGKGRKLIERKGGKSGGK